MKTVSGNATANGRRKGVRNSWSSNHKTTGNKTSCSDTENTMYTDNIIYYKTVHQVQCFEIQIKRTEQLTSVTEHSKLITKTVF